MLIGVLSPRFAGRRQYCASQGNPLATRVESCSQLRPFVMLYRTLVSRPVQLAGFVPIGALALGADFGFSGRVLARNPTVSTPLAEETFNQNAGHLKTSLCGIGWHLLLYHWVCSRRAIGCAFDCRGPTRWWGSTFGGPNLPLGRYPTRGAAKSICPAPCKHQPHGNFVALVLTGGSLSEWRGIPTCMGWP